MPGNSASRSIGWVSTAKSVFQINKLLRRVLDRLERLTWDMRLYTFLTLQVASTVNRWAILAYPFVNDIWLRTHVVLLNLPMRAVSKLIFLVQLVIWICQKDRHWPSFKWIIACAAALSIAADFILTTILILALWKSRSGIKRCVLLSWTGIERQSDTQITTTSTDSVLDTLILYTITTGKRFHAAFDGLVLLISPRLAH